jgi:integrase
MRSLGGGVVVQDNKTGPVYYARVQHGRRQHLERCESEKAARDRAGALRDQIRKAKNRGEEWTPKASEKPAYRVPPPPPVTLERFGETFLTDWASTRRPATRTWYAERLKSIGKVLGERPVASIKKADVLRMMRAAPTPATANANLKALRIVLARAVEWEVATENPAAGVKPLGRPALPQRFLYADDTARLRAAYPSKKPWVRGVIEAALATGMRRGELVRLDWEKHVDLGRQEIRLGSDTKSGKARVIPVNADLKAVLTGLPRATTTSAVFHAKGKPITQEQLRNEWETLRAAAGLDPEFRFHDLRHTAASWMAMRGVPLYEIGAILGHSNPRITQRYAHLCPSYLKGATAALVGYAGPAREVEAV